jgi:hypothetical protein
MRYDASLGAPTVRPHVDASCAIFLGRSYSLRAEVGLANAVAKERHGSRRDISCTGHDSIGERNNLRARPPLRMDRPPTLRSRRLKPIHVQENREADQMKATRIVAILKEMKFKTAAGLLESKGQQDDDLPRCSTRKAGGGSLVTGSNAINSRLKSARE